MSAARVGVSFFIAAALLVPFAFAHAAGKAADAECPAPNENQIYKSSASCGETVQDGDKKKVNLYGCQCSDSNVKGICTRVDYCEGKSCNNNGTWGPCSAPSDSQLKGGTQTTPGQSEPPPGSIPTTQPDTQGKSILDQVMFNKTPITSQTGLLQPSLSPSAENFDNQIKQFLSPTPSTQSGSPQQLSGGTVPGITPTPVGTVNELAPVGTTPLYQTGNFNSQAPQTIGQATTFTPYPPGTEPISGDTFGDRLNAALTGFQDDLKTGTIAVQDFGQKLGDALKDVQSWAGDFVNKTLLYQGQEIAARGAALDTCSSGSISSCAGAVDKYNTSYQGLSPIKTQDVMNSLNDKMQQLIANKDVNGMNNLVKQVYDNIGTADRSDAYTYLQRGLATAGLQPAAPGTPTPPGSDIPTLTASEVNRITSDPSFNKDNPDYTGQYQVADDEKKAFGDNFEKYADQQGVVCSSNQCYVAPEDYKDAVKQLPQFVATSNAIAQVEAQTTADLTAAKAAQYNTSGVLSQYASPTGNNYTLANGTAQTLSDLVAQRQAVIDNATSFDGTVQLSPADRVWVATLDAQIKANFDTNQIAMSAINQAPPQTVSQDPQIQSAYNVLDQARYAAQGDQVAAQKAFDDVYNQYAKDSSSVDSRDFAAKGAALDQANQALKNIKDLQTALTYQDPRVNSFAQAVLSNPQTPQGIAFKNEVLQQGANLANQINQLNTAQTSPGSIPLGTGEEALYNPAVTQQLADAAKQANIDAAQSQIDRTLNLASQYNSETIDPALQKAIDVKTANWNSDTDVRTAGSIIATKVSDALSNAQNAAMQQAANNVSNPLPLADSSLYEGAAAAGMAKSIWDSAAHAFGFATAQTQFDDLTKTSAQQWTSYISDAASTAALFAGPLTKLAGGAFTAMNASLADTLGTEISGAVSGVGNAAKIEAGIVTDTGAIQSTGQFFGANEITDSSILGQYKAGLADSRAALETAQATGASAEDIALINSQIGRYQSNIATIEGRVVAGEAAAPAASAPAPTLPSATVTDLSAGERVTPAGSTAAGETGQGVVGEIKPTASPPTNALETAEQSLVDAQAKETALAEQVSARDKAIADLQNKGASADAINEVKATGPTAKQLDDAGKNVQFYKNDIAAIQAGKVEPAAPVSVADKAAADAQAAADAKNLATYQARATELQRQIDQAKAGETVTQFVKDPDTGALVEKTLPFPSTVDQMQTILDNYNNVIKTMQGDSLVETGGGAAGGGARSAGAGAAGSDNTNVVAFNRDTTPSAAAGGPTAQLNDNAQTVTRTLQTANGGFVETFETFQSPATRIEGAFKTAEDFNTSAAGNTVAANDNAVVKAAANDNIVGATAPVSTVEPVVASVSPVTSSLPTAVWNAAAALGTGLASAILPSPAGASPLVSPVSGGEVAQVNPAPSAASAPAAAPETPQTPPAIAPSTAPSVAPASPPVSAPATPGVDTTPAPYTTPADYIRQTYGEAAGQAARQAELAGHSAFDWANFLGSGGGAGGAGTPPSSTPSLLSKLPPLPTPKPEATVMGFPPFNPLGRSAYTSNLPNVDNVVQPPEFKPTVKLAGPITIPGGATLIPGFWNPTVGANETAWVLPLDQITPENLRSVSAGSPVPGRSYIDANGKAWTIQAVSEDNAVLRVTTNEDLLPGKQPAADAQLAAIPANTALGETQSEFWAISTTDFMQNGLTVSDGAIVQDPAGKPWVITSIAQGTVMLRPATAEDMEADYAALPENTGLTSGTLPSGSLVPGAPNTETPTDQAALPENAQPTSGTIPSPVPSVFSFGRVARALGFGLAVSVAPAVLPDSLQNFADIAQATSASGNSTFSTEPAQPVERAAIEALRDAYNNPDPTAMISTMKTMQGLGLEVVGDNQNIRIYRSSGATGVNQVQIATLKIDSQGVLSAATYPSKAQIGTRTAFGQFNVPGGIWHSNTYGVDYVNKTIAQTEQLQNAQTVQKTVLSHFTDTVGAFGNKIDQTQYGFSSTNLPAGTKVRVTCLSGPCNGQVIEGRVVDRGPSKPGRLLDATQAVAQKWGFLNAGIVQVSFTVVDTPADLIPAYSVGTAVIPSDGAAYAASAPLPPVRQVAVSQTPPAAVATNPVLAAINKATTGFLKSAAQLSGALPPPPTAQVVTKAIVPANSALTTESAPAAPTLAQVAKLSGQPQIPGVDKIVYLTNLGTPPTKKWQNIVIHQTEGPAGQAASLAKDQAASPSKTGATIYVDTDGTVYWATSETASPSHIRANRNDSIYISNTLTYKKVNNQNSIGIEFAGNFPDVTTPLTDAQMRVGQALVEFLQQRYNIPSNNIYAHNWIDYKDSRYNEGDQLAQAMREVGYQPTGTPNMFAGTSPGTLKLSPVPTSVVAQVGPVPLQNNVQLLAPLSNILAALAPAPSGAPLQNITVAFNPSPVVQAPVISPFPNLSTGGITQSVSTVVAQNTAPVDITTTPGPVVADAHTGGSAQQPLVTVAQNPPPASTAPAPPQSNALATAPSNAPPAPKPALSGPAPYTNAEVNKLISDLYLNKLDPKVAAQMLPPRPSPIPNLLPQTNPLLQKPIASMTDAEIKQVAQSTLDSLQKFLAGVYKAHGGTYRPTQIVFIDSAKPLPTGVESGNAFNPKTGKVQIDLDSLRTRNLDYYPATGVAIQVAIAHETGHYLQRLTGVDLKAIRLAIYNNQEPVLYEATGFGGSILEELQADYLGGWMLKGADLLRAGSPEQMYYNVASTGDDIGTAFSPDKLRSILNYTHGPGAIRATTFYDGIKGDENTGLTMLSTEPDWLRANPSMAWADIQSLPSVTPVQTASTPPLPTTPSSLGTPTLPANSPAPVTTGNSSVPPTTRGIEPVVANNTPAPAPFTLQIKITNYPFTPPTYALTSQSLPNINVSYGTPPVVTEAPVTSPFPAFTSESIAKAFPYTPPAAAQTPASTQVPATSATTPPAAGNANTRGITASTPPKAATAPAPKTTTPAKTTSAPKTAVTIQTKTAPVIDIRSSQQIADEIAALQKKAEQAQAQSAEAQKLLPAAQAKLTAANAVATTIKNAKGEVGTAETGLTVMSGLLSKPSPESQEFKKLANGTAASLQLAAYVEKGGNTALAGRIRSFIGGLESIGSIGGRDQAVANGRGLLNEVSGILNTNLASSNKAINDATVEMTNLQNQISAANKVLEQVQSLQAAKGAAEQAEAQEKLYQAEAQKAVVEAQATIDQIDAEIDAKGFKDLLVVTLPPAAPIQQKSFIDEVTAALDEAIFGRLPERVITAEDITVGGAPEIAAQVPNVQWNPLTGESLTPPSLFPSGWSPKPTPTVEAEIDAAIAKIVSGIDTTIPEPQLPVVAGNPPAPNSALAVAPAPNPVPEPPAPVPATPQIPAGTRPREGELTPNQTNVENSVPPPTPEPPALQDNGGAVTQPALAFVKNADGLLELENIPTNAANDNNLPAAPTTVTPPVTTPPAATPTPAPEVKVAVPQWIQDMEHSGGQLSEGLQNEFARVEQQIRGTLADIEAFAEKLAGIQPAPQPEVTPAVPLPLTDEISAKPLTRTQLKQLFDGVADLYQKLTTAVEQNPNVSINDLQNIIASSETQYPLLSQSSPELGVSRIEFVNNVVRNYVSAQKQISDFVTANVDPKQAFKEVFGVEPVGDVSMRVQPGSLQFIVDDPTGEQIFYKYSDPTLITDGQYFTSTNVNFPVTGYRESASALNHETQHIFFSSADQAEITLLNQQLDTYNDAVAQIQSRHETFAQMETDPDYQKLATDGTYYKLLALRTGDAAIRDEMLAYLSDVPDGRYGDAFKSDLQKSLEAGFIPRYEGNFRANLLDSEDADELVAKYFTPAVQSAVTDGFVTIDTLAQKGYTPSEIIDILTPLTSTQEWTVAAALKDPATPAPISTPTPASAPVPAAPTTVLEISRGQLEQLIGHALTDAEATDLGFTTSTEEEGYTRAQLEQLMGRSMTDAEAIDLGFAPTTPTTPIPTPTPTPQPAAPDAVAQSAQVRAAANPTELGDTFVLPLANPATPAVTPASAVTPTPEASGQVLNVLRGAILPGNLSLTPPFGIPWNLALWTGSVYFTGPFAPVTNATYRYIVNSAYRADVNALASRIFGTTQTPASPAAAAPAPAATPTPVQPLPVRVVDTPPTDGVPVVLQNVSAPENIRVTVSAGDLASIGGQDALLGYLQNGSTRGLVSPADRDALAQMQATGQMPAQITFYPLPLQPAQATQATQPLGLLQQLANWIAGPGSGPFAQKPTPSTPEGGGGGGVGGGGGGTGTPPPVPPSGGATGGTSGGGGSSWSGTGRILIAGGGLVAGTIVIGGIHDLVNLFSPATVPASTNNPAAPVSKTPAKTTTTPPASTAPPAQKPPVTTPPTKEAPVETPPPAKTAPAVKTNPAKPAVIGKPAGGDNSTTGNSTGGTTAGKTSGSGGGGIGSALGSILGSLMKLFGIGQPSATPPASTVAPATPTTPTTPSVATPPNPIVNLLPNPTSVASGKKATLSWSGIGISQCTLVAGDGTILGQGGAFGSASTPVLTTTTSFTVTCTASSGATTSAGTTVTVH